LSLVIHVELPRDAETLQHRSGRTGRAGKKGTAILIVPYPRRRRVEGVLRGAKINAEWISAPGPEQIRLRDRERLLEALLAPVEIEDDDRELGRALLAERSAEDIAAALVRSHRARMPAPEELLEPGAGPPREHPQGPRPGFEDTIWFRINAGRRQNADPRWLLPLLCRRGHITKNEVGAIRIGANETAFEIPRAVAGRFSKALARTASEQDDGVVIEALAGNPREAERPRHRPGGAPRPGGPPRHKAKPYRAERGERR
jgi:ATP-dependent RNA helicase DeaD